MSTIINTAKEQGIQLGEIFRLRRIEMNISLKEIENAISIRATHLQAIEEGFIHLNIPSIYAQGFVKQYATYIHLDGEKLLKEYPLAFKKVEKAEFDYGIGTLEVRNIPGNSVRSLPNLLWLFSIVLTLVLAALFARSLKLI